MIDQITNNNQEIEMYYHMGSIHGEIRMMLNKYIYNQNLSFGCTLPDRVFCPHMNLLKLKLILH